jgi:hypothetical protein
VTIGVAFWQRMVAVGVFLGVRVGARVRVFFGLSVGGESGVSANVEDADCGIWFGIDCICAACTTAGWIGVTVASVVG